jgi:hypothetical protein
MHREVESFDPDVLAVLTRGGVEITFVTASRHALDDKDYAVLLWSNKSMTVGVSEEYLYSEIDEYVVDGILSAADLESEYLEEAVKEAVQEQAVSLFAKKLTEVFDNAMQSVDDPTLRNLDYSLERLLNED